MSAPVTAIARWWFAPMPAARLAALRVLVGAFATIYLAIRLPHLLAVAGFAPGAFAPIGVVAILDAPLPPLVARALPLAALALGLAFTLGWRFRVTGPLFAGALLWLLTYRSSWGMIFHTENLLVLHVVVLGASRAADATSLDARGRPAPADDAAYGWPVRLIGAVTCAAYVLAGVAKLANGGTGWISGQVLRDTIAADNLRKIVLGSRASPIAPFFLAHAWLFAALAALTMVVELGAPLALLGGRIAAIWVVLAIGFHLGVLALMAILFPYPLSGIAFAALLPAERVVERVRSFRARRARARSAAP